MVKSGFALIQIFGTDRLVEGRKEIKGTLTGSGGPKGHREYLLKLLTCDRGNPLGGQICNVQYSVFHSIDYK